MTTPTIVYKLTNAEGKTRNNTQWGPGVSHTAIGDNSDLCSDGWIHYYDDPLLAVLLNPIHANFDAPLLWEATTSGAIKEDNGLKFGCKTLTTIRQIPLPIISIEQRIKFAILCALEVHQDGQFAKWANDWLTNKDRSYAAAADAAYAAARSAAARAAAAAAAYAAAAAAAAYAAARSAVYAAARAATTLSLKTLAQKAMQ